MMKLKARGSMKDKMQLEINQINANLTHVISLYQELQTRVLTIEGKSKETIEGLELSLIHI